MRGRTLSGRNLKESPLEFRSWGYTVVDNSHGELVVYLVISRDKLVLVGAKQYEASKKGGGSARTNNTMDMSEFAIYLERRFKGSIGKYVGDFEAAYRKATGDKSAHLQVSMARMSREQALRSVGLTPGDPAERYFFVATASRRGTDVGVIEYIRTLFAIDHVRDFYGIVEAPFRPYEDDFETKYGVSYAKYLASAYKAAGVTSRDVAELLVRILDINNDGRVSKEEINNILVGVVGPDAQTTYPLFARTDFHGETGKDVGAYEIRLRYVRHATFRNVANQVGAELVNWFHDRENKIARTKRSSMFFNPKQLQQLISPPEAPGPAPGPVLMRRGAMRSLPIGQSESS